MKLYYGTTSDRCAEIRRHGLVSRQGELWLSCSFHVARARALHASHVARGRPLVAVCRLNPSRETDPQLSFRRRGPMVAISGRLGPGRILEFLPVEQRQPRAPRHGVLTRGEVFTLLDSPSPKVRIMGVMMLAGQDAPECFDWLCTRLEDPDPRVRLAVAMALRRLGSDTADLLERLRGREALTAPGEA